MILTHKLTQCSQRGTAVASPGNTVRCAYLQSIVAKNITLVNLYHARLLRVTQLNIGPILSLIFNKGEIANVTASICAEESTSPYLQPPDQKHQTDSNHWSAITSRRLPRVGTCGLCGTFRIGKSRRITLLAWTKTEDSIE